MPDVPTTDWGTLVRSYGYSVVYGAQVYGIPYDFGERTLYTVTGVEAAASSSRHTRSAALMVRESDAVSVEPDREQGLAAGRSLDLVLRRQSLVDEGLTSTLFAIPGYRTRLSADVTSATSASIAVESTTGFATSGFGYVDLECVYYTATDSTHFDGCERGLAGLPHYHRSSDVSGYSEMTDVPTTWRGRFVVLYEHLVGPDGRYLGDTWNTVGLYCRERWKGYVDAVPHATPDGKVLRCLPLVRLAAQKIGAKITGRPAFTQDGQPRIYWTETDVIQIRRDSAGTLASGPTAFAGGIRNVQGWVNDARTGLGSGWSGSAGMGVVVFTYTGFPALTAIPRAWFLAPGQYSAGNGTVSIPLRFDVDHGWLVIHVDPSEDASAEDVPERGYLRVTVGEDTEVMRFDGVYRDASRPALVALQIAARSVGGTKRVNPWYANNNSTLAHDGTLLGDTVVEVVTGSIGLWSDAFRAMATTSGLGVRGDFDNLGYGYGLGIPDEWLDLDSLTASPMGSTSVDALTADDTTIADTLCGWLALWGRCLVQRRSADGHVRLAVVQTGVESDPQADAIGVADVLLGGHGQPELADAPNILEVSVGDDKPKVIPRSRARMAAEGDRRWVIRAAGAVPEDVAGWAVPLLTMGDGQSTVTLELAPGSDVQSGDSVRLTTAHPLTFDAGTGDYAPSEIAARVLHVEDDLWSGLSRVTLLVSGVAPAATLLCPSARALGTWPTSPTDTLVVRDGHEERFPAGTAVYVYEPGFEATRKSAMVVDSTGTNPSRIKMTSSLPAFCTLNAAVVVTYDDYVSGSGDALDYMYYRSDKVWR